MLWIYIASNFLKEFVGGKKKMRKIFLARQPTTVFTSSLYKQALVCSEETKEKQHYISVWIWKLYRLVTEQCNGCLGSCLHFLTQSKKRNEMSFESERLYKDKLSNIHFVQGPVYIQSLYQITGKYKFKTPLYWYNALYGHFSSGIKKPVFSSALSIWHLSSL